MARSARWAGQFYPGDRAELAGEIDRMIAAWPGRESSPWALLVPHAGYVYSGAAAAAAYALLPEDCGRVILLGPAHHEAVDGFGLSLEDAWETPLGEMRVDTEALRQLLSEGAPFGLAESALAKEHCLEVQLPFIQRRCPGARILPIVVGRAGAEARRRARERLAALSRPGDVWLVSTDLSHYHGQAEAERLDAEAERLIAGAAARPFEEALVQGRVEACGAVPVLMLLEEAERRGARLEVLDRRDSALASGDRDCVVGYLAAASWE